MPAETSYPTLRPLQVEPIGQCAGCKIYSTDDLPQGVIQIKDEAGRMIAVLFDAHVINIGVCEDVKS